MNKKCKDYAFRQLNWNVQEICLSGITLTMVKVNKYIHKNKAGVQHFLSSSYTKA